MDEKEKRRSIEDAFDDFQKELSDISNRYLYEFMNNESINQIKQEIRDVTYRYLLENPGLGSYISELIGKPYEGKVLITCEMNETTLFINVDDPHSFSKPVV